MLNFNSLLVAVDDRGQIHYFLDGSYSLGQLPFQSDWFPMSVFKNHFESTIFVQAENRSTGGAYYNTILPVVIELPLLNADTVRRVAENCTTARELIWHIIRSVKEMRKVWFGEDGFCSAREMNANWVHGLAEKQAQFGRKMR